MWRQILLFLLLNVLAQTYMHAQYTPLGADTLINMDFETVQDPILQMLNSPGGMDNMWVNYDEDSIPPKCIEEEVVYGWYWEGDFGAPLTDNNALSSCSWLTINGIRNKNWLITPPIYIPDSTHTLSWRSLSYQGPAFHDGYKVLVSTSSNDPKDGFFSDTLFVQAEMVEYFGSPTSLQLSDFEFSEGYIQANGYTNNDYFELDTIIEGGSIFPFFRGIFEPHSVSLKKYVDNLIYIAFLHDSAEDYLLQIDDIVISGDPLAGTADPYPENILQYEVYPNPSDGATWVSWKLSDQAPVHMRIVDAVGRTLWSSQWENNTSDVRIQLPPLQPGLYHCVLQTGAGTAAKNLVIRK